MALVALVKGVNVGGHRTFRPAELAKRLAHLDVVNIGAAGTFVIREPIAHARLRAELTSRLPFDAVVMICAGRDILNVLSKAPFEGRRARADSVHFVSVLARNPRNIVPTPVSLPSARQWQVKILARERRFVFGVYRRSMQAIGYLGEIDRLFGMPATTRNWNTIVTIGRVLGTG